MTTVNEKITVLARGQTKGKYFEDTFFSRGRVSRPFGLRSKLLDCTFERCVMAARSSLTRTSFHGCQFLNCKIGGSEPVYTTGIDFHQCHFEGCDISIWENGESPSSKFTDCAIHDCKIHYFNFRKTDFSGTKISSVLKQFSLSDCFGANLDLSESLTDYGLIIGAQGFEKIVLPHDAECGFWRDYKQIFSRTIFDLLKSDLKDPKAALKQVQTVQKTGGITLAYVDDRNFRDFFDLNSGSAMRKAMKVVGSFHPDHDSLGKFVFPESYT